MRSKDFRITQDIFKRFGYTEGCVGCEARKSGMDHRNHTAMCRLRLEARMSEDEQLKQTIQKRNTIKGKATEKSDEQLIPGEVPGAPADDVNMTPGPAEESFQDEYEGMAEMKEAGSSNDEEVDHEPATSTHLPPIVPRSSGAGE